MAKKEPRRLTPLETLIMDALWDMPPSTVREVQKTLDPVKPMAYNTVLTMMRILRDKGFLISERHGRTDVYQPVVARAQVGQRSLREVLENFFSGSAQALVSQLLDSENLSPEDLRAIRQEVDGKLNGGPVSRV